MTTAPVDLAPLEATGRDLQDAAMVAARAFHNDPFFEYLDPNGVTRARGLALFWRATIAAAAARADITGARDREGRLVGVAAVLRPGRYPLALKSQGRQLAGAFRALVIRPPALAKGTKYLLAMDKAHPKEPLWYLLLLVVDPAVQRSGIGGRLQQAMLEGADREGLPCYLETQKQDNVAYYRRFGYEVDRELRPVKGGPPLFTMRREARPAEG